MPSKPRFLQNTLPDGIDLSPRHLGVIGAALKDALEEVLLCGKRHEDLHGTSVYLGISGVAMALRHTSLALQHVWDKGDRSFQAALAPHTPHSLLAAANSMCEDALRSPPHKTRVTFLEGGAGPLALLAVLQWELGQPTWRQHLEALLLMASQQVPQLGPGECEVLYGRAGYLWALLWAQRRLPPGSVPRHLLKELVRHILTQGRSGAAELGWPVAGLMFQWHGSAYLGAAHGLAGILYVLCHAMDVVDELDREQQGGGQEQGLEAAAGLPDGGGGSRETCGRCGTGRLPGSWRAAVEASISGLVAACLPSGNLPSSLGKAEDRLVQWCHGAPGLTFLLPVASHLWPDRAPAWLAAAEAAGEVVWQRGLVLKGVGLCHGLAGSSYALLALACPAGPTLPQALHPGLQALALRCRRRAFQMALFAADQWRQMYDTPDTPASLYEGLSGLVCLLADVMASLALPDDAGGYIPTMPGFQLP